MIGPCLVSLSQMLLPCSRSLVSPVPCTQPYLEVPLLCKGPSMGWAALSHARRTPAHTTPPWRTSLSRHRCLHAAASVSSLSTTPYIRTWSCRFVPGGPSAAFRERNTAPAVSDSSRSPSFFLLGLRPRRPGHADGTAAARPAAAGHHVAGLPGCDALALPARRRHVLPGRRVRARPVRQPARSARARRRVRV